MKFYHAFALLTLSLLVISYSVESRALEKRGFWDFLDKFKFEDDKVKYPIGKDKSITIGKLPGNSETDKGATVGFEWKFGKRTMEKRGFWDFLDKIKFEDDKAKYPIGKDKSITIGKLPGNSETDKGATVGFEWKFGKRTMEKRGFWDFLDKIKFEDDKAKYPIGKDKSITIGKLPGNSETDKGATVGFEWKFGKRTMEKRGFWDFLDKIKFEDDKAKYPIGKDKSITIGKLPGNSETDKGATVGFEWKFGKRTMDKRGFFDKFKFEDGKIKYPVGKDKSITIGGDPTGKGLGASLGFEWKFGK